MHRHTFTVYTHTFAFAYTQRFNEHYESSFRDHFLCIDDAHKNKRTHPFILGQICDQARA